MRCMSPPDAFAVYGGRPGNELRENLQIFFTVRAVVDGQNRCHQA